MKFRDLKTAVLTGSALLLLALVSAGPAQAANTRVSITDFAWSKEPNVDLGESVTWDWIGPDLHHSITGQAPNASQWDSDPGTSSPLPLLGRSYTVTFDDPGSYLFICKVHPQAVRGTVTVSDQPGDPNSDPGPRDPLKFDLEPPQVDLPRLSHQVIGPRGRGMALTFENSEKGTGMLDYYRIVKRKVGKKKFRNVRRFAGYHEAPVHIGLNMMRAAHRSPTFKALPGKYVVIFRVDDQNRNSSPDFPLRFEIKGKAKKKRR